MIMQQDGIKWRTGELCKVLWDSFGGKGGVQMN